MVWSSLDARDIPPDENKLICHTNRKCGIVVCLLCDGGWCRSDFNVKVKANKGFYLTNNLIVCPKHANVTYNIFDQAEKGDNVLFEIQNKKLLLLNAYIQSIAEGTTTQDINMDEEIAQSEVNSIASDVESASSYKKRRREGDSEFAEDCANCAFYCQENTLLKELSNTLKEHNSELGEHNRFLRTQVEQKSLPMAPPPISFSSVVAKNSKKNLETAQLIIEPNSNYKGNVLQTVQKEIAKQKNVRILSVKKIKNDKVLVKCVNKAESEQIVNALNNNHSNNLIVAQTGKKNPQIKIINIATDLNKQQLYEDILTRNNLVEDDFKIVHVFEQKNKKQTLIVEVTPEAYSQIMYFKSIFVEYHKCRALDNYNDNMCKNCCGYGHGMKKCTRNQDCPPTCPKCSKNHRKDTACDTGELACINCIKANDYLQKKRDIHHAADDKKCCETYKIRWEKYIGTINYPYRPKEPFTKE